ncbi:pantothenate kinase [Spinellus fusiger]|nr:pantothenate kinase [Spinellus fusiger]
MNVLGASVSEANYPAHETRDIVLPNQDGHVSQIAVDKFETEHIDECIDFIAALLEDAHHLTPKGEKQVLKATGGGAHLYHDRLANRFPGVIIQKEDEMECLITGLSFFLTEIPYEAFTYNENNPEPMQFEEKSANMYPFMLVNIGSGVSILKVTGPNEFSRISGTSLGGGTLWGLLSLLTNAQSFDDMLEISQGGDNKNIDLMVGDIYGTDYTKHGLKSTRIASSFGKVFRKDTQRNKEGFNPQDISKSLLFMISNNIGQIAYLNAQQHGLKKIYFGGYFIRGHPVTMNTLSYAINFWSKGEMTALFLRHEGHLGATGAFLTHKPIRKARQSFSYSENFSPNRTLNDPSQVLRGLEAPNLELRSDSQI